MGISRMSDGRLKLSPITAAILIALAFLFGLVGTIVASKALAKPNSLAPPVRSVPATTPSGAPHGAPPLTTTEC